MIATILAGLTLVSCATGTSLVPRLYVCLDGRCVKQPIVNPAPGASGLERCRMSCGSGSLWPIPTGQTTLSNESAFVNISEINVTPNVVVPLFTNMTDLFKVRIIGYFSSQRQRNGSSNTNLPLQVNVRISTPSIDPKIDLSIDESYSLTTTCSGDKTSVEIDSTTVFGARHALETLSQLIVFDDIAQGVIIMCGAIIKDKPAFPYRGISIDTARNYYPIEALRSLVDAMSFNKLNRLHWHISDNQAFPLEINSYPNMTTYGVYQPDEVYYQSDVISFVKYALVNGVAVVPEIDSPAHVGHGWDWATDAGMPQPMLICWDPTCFGAPCGYLDPTNKELYTVLKNIYAEMLPLFASDIFHLGGDEVDFDCWNSTATIIAQMGSNRTDGAFHKFWAEYQDKNFESLMNASVNTNVNFKKAVLWSSSLTNLHPEMMSNSTERYIFEVWDSSATDTIPQLVSKGYQVIVANYDAWYLDCGFGQWVSEGVNWCSPYKEWQLVYNNRPYAGLHGKWNITDPNERKLILGGEGAIWSEEIDANSLAMKVWPRAAAIAERLWSDPATCWYEATGRMQMHRLRLVARGVQADALQPYWCTQNEFDCMVPPTEWEAMGLSSTCPAYQRTTPATITTTSTTPTPTSTTSTTPTPTSTTSTTPTPTSTTSKPSSGNTLQLDILVLAASVIGAYALTTGIQQQTRR